MKKLLKNKPILILSIICFIFLFLFIIFSTQAPNTANAEKSTISLTTENSFTLSITTNTSKSLSGLNNNKYYYYFYEGEGTLYLHHDNRNWGFLGKNVDNVTFKVYNSSGSVIASYVEDNSSDEGAGSTTGTNSTYGSFRASASGENTYIYWDFKNLNGTYKVYIWQKGQGYGSTNDGQSATLYLVFDISKKNPTGTLTNVSDGGITNKDVTFSWTNPASYYTYSATLDNNTYTSGTSISSEGTHTIKLINNATNSNTTYTFTIDKTAPTGTLSNVSNGGITNKSVSFTWAESSSTATLNGNSYSNGKNISADGQYTIVLTDKAGNSSTYTFEIDKTAPTGTLSNVSNGGITNKNVTFTWTESNCTATLNGNSYTSGTSISSEGTYTIVLTDRAGNSSTYTFEIDKTAPTGTLSNVSNGGITNKSVQFSWSNSATATLNGNSYTSGTSISSEGTYTIVLTDKAGNSSTYTFTIDKTAPTGTLSNVSNGGITNKSVSFTWTDSYTTATLNGNSYTSGTSISSEGTHTIKLTDRANNIKTYTFTIDKTAPTGTLSNVSNGGITNKNVTFTWTESNCTATLDNNTYTSGTSISSERTHTLVLTDKAGNSSTYTFEIDKTAPTGTLSNVSNGGITNKSVTFTWTESDCSLTLNDTTLSYILKNNVFTTTIEVTEFIKQDCQLKLTDKAGNSSTYNFTIDKRKPQATIRNAQGQELSDNDKVFSAVYFIFDDNYNANIDGEPYVSNTRINGIDDGIHTYEFTIFDNLGNINTYHITIDRVKPIINFYNGSTLLNIAPNSTFYYNKSVSINFEPNNVVTLITNDINQTINNRYVLEPQDNTEFSYTIKIKNSLSQLTNEYTIVLDTIPFTANLNYLRENSKNYINSWYETYDYTLYEQQYTQNNRYSFSNYNDCYNFAQQRELLSAEFHEEYLGGTIYCSYNGVAINNIDIPNLSNYIGMPYYIYKDTNSASKLVAYFNTSNLFNAIDSYAKKSISQKTIPSIPASEFQGFDFGTIIIAKQEVFNDTFYIKQSNFSLPYNSNTNLLVINGNIENYSYIFSSNINTITETDRAGNSITYKICVDTSAPSLTATDFAGNNLSNLIDQLNSTTIDTVYYNSPFRCYINDNLDLNSLLSVTINSSKYIIFGQDEKPYFDFNTSGTYNVVARDKAGNIREFSLIIVCEKPTIQVSDLFDSNNILTSFNVNISKKISNQISAINVLTYNKDTATWLSVLTDDNNNVINSNTLNYTFATSGHYKIEVIDLFQEITTYEYTFTKNAPLGRLITHKDVVLQSGAVVNAQVKFTWTDSYATATLNGEDYLKDTFIVSAGFYTIELTDKSGVSSIYTFTIDKNPPIYQLKGVEANGTTNGIVSVFWDINQEEGTTAKIKVGNGEYNQYINNSDIINEGSYSIQLTDRAGNITYVSFTIDKTAPNIILTTSLGKVFPNMSIVNTGVKITWTGSATVYINGTTLYTKDTIIKTDGLYNVSLIDTYGNTNNATFSIDTKAPTGSLIGVNENGYATDCVSFYWEENGCTATLNGEDYAKNSIIPADGEYELILTDKAGNNTIYKFVIDTKAPTGTFSDVLGNIYSNDFFINKNVSFTWSQTATATLNGEPYTKNTSISQQRTHTLVLTDKAGNSTTYSFTIDKTAPTGTLSNVSNGGITNKNVTFTWTESNCTATLNGLTYLSNSIIDIEKNTTTPFTLILTDKAGNSTTYNFTIDKTAPTGTLNNVSDSGITNKSVTFTWTESNCTATLNGEPYTKDTKIVEDGQYEIVLTDKAGNSTTYTFTINKSLPSFIILNIENIELYEKSFYNETIIIVFSNELTQTLLNNEPYVSGTPIEAEGKYTLVLTDRAGNKSTFSFTIDKTAPTGTLNGVENNSCTNKIVKFSWTESNCTATLNGEPYTKDTKIVEDGQYEIVLTDRAENSTTYTFTIYTQGLNYTITNINEAGYTSSNFMILFDNNHIVMVNNEPYVSGTIIDADGEYNIKITNLANITETRTIIVDTEAPIVYFITQNNEIITDEIINYSFLLKAISTDIKSIVLNNETHLLTDIYNQNGTYVFEIKDFADNVSFYTITLNSSKPIGYFNVDFIDDTTNQEVIFTWSESNCTATLNGEPYIKGTTINADGEYEIVLIDDLGNFIKYYFNIFTELPTATFYNKNNETIANNSVVNTEIRLDYQNKYKATINNEPYVSGTYLKGIEDTSVSYVITLYDKYNNVNSYSIIIDRISPSIEEAYETEFYSNENKVFTFDDTRYNATLNNEPYVSGTPIEAEGNYSLVLTSKSNNIKTYTFTIDKTAPTGSLSNINEKGYALNTTSFNWEESGCKATINNEPYTKNTIINKDGQYELILTDKAGNSTTYNFIIDKTPVELKAEYNQKTKVVDRNASFNSPIKLFSNGSIIVNGEEYKEEIELTTGKYNVIVTLNSGRTASYTINVNIPTVTEEQTTKTLVNIFAILVGAGVVTFITIRLIKSSKSSKKKIL